jgi:hypothetical protein
MGVDRRGLAPDHGSPIRDVRTDTGYRTAEYAASLSGFGRPVALPRSGGWILERGIAGTALVDAMGCYPVFACRDWSGLGDDLESLAGHLVSVSLVTDAFGNWTEAVLRRSFDRVQAFKQHYVYDLALPPDLHVARSHRRNARRALRRLRVEVTPDPVRHVEEWAALYATLIQRHGITGLRAFSTHAFEKQLAVPGVTMLRAFDGSQVVAAQLWYAQADIGYCHLTAGTTVAYAVDAAYALYWSAIQHFREGLRWLDIGAESGLSGHGTDGLGAFKRGWASGTRPVYFCGRIFDRRGYDELLRQRRVGQTDYFPAYREDEFA